VYTSGIAGAKSYADASAQSQASGAITTASADATAKANAALASANAYIDGAYSILRTSIIQNSSSIALKASQTDLDSIGNRVSASEAAITLNASNIDLKVSKDNIINSINVSTEGITINASHINITGSLNLDGMFTGGLIRADKIDVDNLTAKHLACTDGHVACFRIDQWSLSSITPLTYIDMLVAGTSESYISSSEITHYSSDGRVRATIGGLGDTAIEIAAGKFKLPLVRWGTVTGHGVKCAMYWDSTTQTVYWD